MGKLMNYLYPLGYALQIVPEFKSLTVGGLIVEDGLESSSVNYGLFHLQCIEYTIVLGNGEIRKVKKKILNYFFHTIIVWNIRDNSRCSYEYYTNKTEYTFRMYSYI